MLWQEFSPLTRDNQIEPERMLRLGAGAAVAPMWAAYLAATGMGVTYWWMTAWTRRLGVETEARSFAPVIDELALAFTPEPVAETVTAEAGLPEIVTADAVADLVAEPAAIDLAQVVEDAPEMLEQTAEQPAASEAPAVLAAKPARRKPTPKLDA